MRLIVQLVKESSCTIDGRITGAINKGFMVLVGFGPDDNEEIARKMALVIMKER